MDKELKIGITGYKGQIGSLLIQRGCIPIYGDVTNRVQITENLRVANPDVVIYCAAISDPTLCEKNPIKALAVNLQGAINVFDYFTSKEQLFVYISTDHIFSGVRSTITGYKETDAPHPLNIYGGSKWAAEEALNFSSFSPARLRIIRTSKIMTDNWLDNIHHNLTLGNVSVPSFIYRSFMYADDFVQNLLHLVSNSDRIIERYLNISGFEILSYFDLYKLVADVSGQSISKIIERKNPSDEYTVEVPYKAGLDVTKAKSLGFPIRETRKGIEDWYERYRNK